MKKSFIGIGSVAVIASVLVGTLVMSNFPSGNFVMATDKPDTMSCDYYWNEANGYTSIETIISSGVVGDTYKTWGTVTRMFTQSSSVSFYIQSTNKNSTVGSAGLLIWKSLTWAGTVREGSVVTVEGKYDLYSSAVPEIIEGSVTVDYYSNPYPVEAIVTDTSFWTNALTTFASRKTVLVSASNIKVTSSTGLNNIYMFAFEDSGTEFKIRARPGLTDANDTLSKLNTAVTNDNFKTSVIGILSTYSNVPLIEIVSASDVTIESDPPTPVLSTITLDSSSYSVISGKNYATGNYGQLAINSVDYIAYRAYKPASDFMQLIPHPSIAAELDRPDMVAGYFANYDPILDIDSIEITYRTGTVSDPDETSTVKPSIQYGTDFETMSSVSLDYQASNTIYTLDLSQETNQINCFKIFTGEGNTYLNSVVIKYYNTGDAPVHNNNSYSFDLNYTRAKATVFDGTPTTGSQVTVNGKVYTYYTYNDVVTGGVSAAVASYTEPVDVANYFQAFGTAPANYVSSGNFAAATAYFGLYTRQITPYELTTGYATAVPYRYSSSDKTTPYYYELDIDITGFYIVKNVDDTYTQTRGVGRLVIWKNGFAKYSYDYSYVSIYTDDHYSTFQEYDNKGSFMKRFDAQLDGVTDYVWSEVGATDAYHIVGSGAFVGEGSEWSVESGSALNNISLPATPEMLQFSTTVTFGVGDLWKIRSIADSQQNPTGTSYLWSSNAESAGAIDTYMEKISDGYGGYNINVKIAGTYTIYFKISSSTNSIYISTPAS